MSIQPLASNIIKALLTMAISFGVYTVKAEQLDTVVPNGILPYVTELRIQTSLNNNIVRLNDTLIVELAVSESVIPPVVTINGDIVAMTGDYDSWRGEYVLQQPPITAGVSESVHGKAIPVTVSLEDLSGEATTYNQFGDQQLFYAEYFYQVTDISGEWRLAQKAGAYGVGRAEGSIGDWSSTDFSLSQRDCLFDDTYTFAAADPYNPTYGVFTQDMGDSTWYETWQPAANPGGLEECNIPYAPFDGSTPGMTYKWDISAGTLTLYGLGAHIGMPRVANLVENKGEDITSVTYKIETASENFIALNILSGGPSPWWHFELERVRNADGTLVADDSDGNSGSSVDTGSDDTGGNDQVISEQNDYSAAEPTIKGPFDMTAGFGSPLLPTVAGNGDIFSVPAASNSSDANPDAYVGFASQANGEFPLTFGAGGSIIFYGSVPAGQVSSSASVRFKLENQPVDPEVGDVSVTEPSYTTESVIISGAEPGLYSFNIPAQLSYTFSNIIMYIDTPDVEVKITDVAAMVTPATADNGDAIGPFDMTMQFGDGVVTGDLGEFFTNYSSLGFGYSGFASSTTDLYPLTFGGGGTISFTAAVPDGQAATDALVRFKFEKEASETGDIFVTEPSCTSSDVTVSGSTEAVYSIYIPVQGDRTFSSFVMYVDTLDTTVKIGNVMVSTTASSDATPVDCGSDTLLYGEKGPFDMTGAYGDAVIDGDNGDLFRVPSNGGNGYAGYVNQGEATNLYPLTFGDGGTLTFKASIPEGQAISEADIVFFFEKEPSETGDSCTTRPSFKTAPETITGASDLTYTIEIPAQGANTFSSFIMQLETEDVQVKVFDVMMTTTQPAEGEPDVPAGCGPSTEPSVFLDGDGVNTAGYFTGVYGGENGGLNTQQSGDVYTFPTEAASYGGFANDNTDLYPITFNSFLNGSPLITFCASSDSVANVFFQLENNPYPRNGTIKESEHIEISGDGVIRAYTAAINLTGPVQNWNSFLMFIEERDLPVTIGKIKANWNGNNSPDLVGYCDDFTSAKGSNTYRKTSLQNQYTNSTSVEANNSFVSYQHSGHVDYDNSELAHLIAGEFHYCYDYCRFDGNNHDDEFPQENFDPAKYFSDRYGIDLVLTQIAGNTSISGNNSEFVTNDSSLGSDLALLIYDFSYISEYPLTFGDGGYLTVRASVPAGQASNEVKVAIGLIDLEGVQQNNCIIPQILISGDTDKFYSIQIPPQGNRSFAGLVVRIDTPNIGIRAFDGRIVPSPPVNAEQVNCSPFTDITGSIAVDNATPQQNDTLGPQITLNSPGDIAIILESDGSISYIPTNDIDVRVSILGFRQNHELGVPFYDAGAGARDLWQGYVTYQTDGIIDTNVQGIQTITYTAYDSSGNSSTLIREVNVVDVTPPVITLNGNPTELIHVNSTYIDPSATAFDAVDGYLAVFPTILIEEKSKQDGSFSVVAEIDLSETGEYRYTYTFTDAAGNSASTSRKVLVIPDGGDSVVILENGNAGIEFDSPIQAFDQDLNWNSCSSAECPSIDFGWVDDEDRDHQVLQVSHAQTTAGAGVFISSSDPIDLRGSREDGFYQLDLKVISGDRRISFKADCGYPCGGGNQDITVSQHGVWETIAVPVEDLIPNGPEGNILDLEIVKGGLIIQATGAYGTVFRIDNVIWRCGTTCEGVDIPYVPVDWESTHEDKAVGYDAPTSYDGYTQVWADEFSGNAVDYQKWGFDLGNGDGGWSNGELQHYRTENASVDNGMLIIEAKKHQPALPGGIRYTSAKLKTDGKFQFKYGRVDVRAVVAEGKGLWSAAWMLGANHSQIGWPYSGEIDIVDTIGGTRDGIPQEGMIVHNMYWNAAGPNPYEPYSPSKININGSAEYRINDSNEGETFSNKFHVFSLIWDEDKIQFQVDGVDTVYVNLANSLADTFRNPFYLILNVAVGGAWPGSPGDNMNFPDGMLVDYVRVYQVDTDGDGVADYDLDGDTPLDAFPNNPAESVDSDGDGIGDNADGDSGGSNTNNNNGDTGPLNPNTPISTESQIISVLGNPVGLVGKTVSIDVGYNTSDNLNQTPGTGFRVHSDSSVLTINNISNVLQKDLIVDGVGPIYDAENYDGDSSTDIYYSFGWAALMGDWPDQELPARVLTLEAQINPFVVTDEQASTPINFSSTSVAAGYEFTANNYDLELMSSSWDFDGNGQADALTDGLIMLRYAFGVRGDDLIENALSPESTMTSSDMELVMGMSSTIADIDANGEVNALTDGLILMRYLFGLKNESMIDRVVAPNASRTSLQAITQHIDRYMPN